MKTVIGSLVTAALVLVFASPAAAQDPQPVTVNGGVSFFHFNDCCTEPGFRAEIAKAFSQVANGNIAIAGELGWTGSDGSSTLTLGAGPRFNVAVDGSVQPFVHVLLGLARYGFEDGESFNNFFFAPGGGVTFPVNDRVHAFGQIDLMIVKGDGFTDYGQRFTFGVGFELGQ